MTLRIDWSTFATTCGRTRTEVRGAAAMLDDLDAALTSAEKTAELHPKGLSNAGYNAAKAHDGKVYDR